MDFQFRSHSVKLTSEMFHLKILCYLGKKIKEKFHQQFGFDVNQVNVERITEYLHRDEDASSLAVTRILFGLAMIFDMAHERGGSDLAHRWGDPTTCHFPLFPFLRHINMPYMAVVFAFLCYGAFGIMFGYRYRSSSITFALCYWYIFLIDKTFWNNHSYLFGLVAFLLTWTQANCYWSIDAYLDPTKRRDKVPYWNYFLLKYQFFILYFVAGLKKGTAEWLSGYSLPYLGEHWVFDPFKLILNTSQIDYLIVHCFAFIFDLTIAFWMMWARTRNIAMVFCAAFHIMNIRLFEIGMFPWVCLATMPLFYPFDWPKRLMRGANDCYKRICQMQNKPELACESKEANYEKDNNGIQNPDESVKNDNFDKNISDIKNHEENKNIELINGDKVAKNDNENKNEVQAKKSKGTEKDKENNDAKSLRTIIIKEKHIENNDTVKDIQNDEVKKEKRNIQSKMTTFLILFYCLLQLFLPYSHFITKGYNNWNNGLYGYSWDMMVHTWEAERVVIKLVDNDMNKEFYIKPHKWTLTSRWSRHSDMIYQYAHCVKRNVLDHFGGIYNQQRISSNISIYGDIWYSLNNRFQQRLIDPNTDLIQAEWSPFKPVSWLKPLLINAEDRRSELDEIRRHVHSWNNKSSVVFIADFPGYSLENYLPLTMSNVTLTILDGVVAFDLEVNADSGQSFVLKTGENMHSIPPETIHKIINIGDVPVFYMYTYQIDEEETNNGKNGKKMDLIKEFYKSLIGVWILFKTIFLSIGEIVFFRLPMWLGK